MPEFISILRWIRDIVYPKLLETNENVKIVADNMEEVKALNTSIEDGVFPFEKLTTTTKTIDSLLTLHASDGDTVIVKDLNRGGTFIYDANMSAINNGGTIFNGWVRQYSGAVNVKWFGDSLQNSLFGRTGLRLTVGEKRDAHYAWGSIVEIPNSIKWVMIYRKGTRHGTEDGAEVRAIDSYDFGKSWVNDRLVHSDTTTDSRADRIAVMANGRIGFFCNRSSEGTNKYPLFISSDDEGVTWNKLEVPTSSTTYTFSAVGGIVSYPTSQGGNDTTGFVSFGYINALGVDAFTTIDNGDSWSIVSNVNGSDVLNENVIIRLGDSDRWLIFVRNEQNMMVYATTNILSWGTAVDSGLKNLSTPPAGYYDEDTNKIYSFATARSGKEIDGYVNNILSIGEDADTLWNNNGVFTGEYKSLVTAPNWTTGYFSPFKSQLGVCATFTAGENLPNGLPPSSVWLIGDFETSGADIGMFVDKYTRNIKNINSMEITATDNKTDNYSFRLHNKAKTASVIQSPYIFSRNGGGSSYLMAYNNGDVQNTYSKGVSFKSEEDMTFDVANSGNIKFLDYNVMFGGLDTKINNESSSIHIPVGGSTTPAMRSQTKGTSSSRKHYILHHTSGTSDAPEVGSISTTTTATAFNTSSDETLKDFIGELSGDEAIAIIKADPTRKFIWKINGEEAIGWGAQTSYEISEDLATKGGWYLNDEEVDEDTEGAIYVPWSIDKSKRTPYLWAAVSKLIDEIDELKDKIVELENK